MARKSGKTKVQASRAWLALYATLLCVAVALAAAMLLIRLPDRAGYEPEAWVAPEPTPSMQVANEPETPGDSGQSSTERPKLVIVLDDAGHNLWQLEPFLKLPFPLTIAVLPGLPYTARAADLARQAGKELILHQPMEAMNGLDEGPGSISGSMDETEIRRILRQNMKQVPAARGMNNHMGSLASADPYVMNIVLDEVRRANWYFLDSVTTGASVAGSIAAGKSMQIWERTVFLDNSPDRDYIVNRLNEGSRIAAKHGYAVMIGHVWSAELAQTLADLYPQLLEQGYSLTTIANILMEKDDAGSGN